jgi:hypothetical protein
MAEYHNADDVKFICESGVVRKTYVQQAKNKFIDPKNISYLKETIAKKYKELKINDSRKSVVHKIYLDIIKNISEDVHRFKVNIPHKSYFQESDVWKAVKFMNWKFIKNCLDKISTTTKYIGRESYLQKELYANHLFPSGFESLNADVKFGRQNNSNDDWDTPDPNADEEVTRARYYGEDFATSEAAVKIHNARKNNPNSMKGPKIEGVPFMVDPRPRTSKWISSAYTARAADLQERDIQRAVGLEDNFEYDCMIRGNVITPEYYKKSYEKRQKSRVGQFLL